MSDQIEIVELGVGVSWDSYDPADWRKHPEPKDIDKENDEDEPISKDVLAIVGFDPDKEWG